MMSNRVKTPILPGHEDMYCLHVLTFNPIRESELKYYCPALKAKIKRKNYHPHGILRETWYKAWNEFFKTHPAIMIEKGMKIYYVDKDGKKIPGMMHPGYG